jgi:putative restriction endonuclease
VRGFVGNTDFDWFSFLKERQPIDEVNFRQPSGGDKGAPDIDAMGRAA